MNSSDQEREWILNKETNQKKYTKGAEDTLPENLDYENLNTETRDSLNEVNYTVEQLIEQIGVSRWQKVSLLLLALIQIGQNTPIQLQPYLSARLYVELEMTSTMEALLSAASMGGGVTNILWGLCADRWGRKWALIVSSTTLLTANLLTCLSPSYKFIVVCRLLVSLSRSASLLAVPYLTETLPAKYRWAGSLLVIHLSGAVLGGALPIVMALFFLHKENSWQLYLVLCSLPLILFIILSALLFDESAAFLASKGKLEDAKKIICKYATSKHVGLTPNFNLKLEVQKNCSNLDGDKKYSFTENLIYSLKSWKIMRSFLCIILIGTTTRMANFGKNFVVTNLLFLLGEVGSYCEGTEKQSYYLETEDYMRLLLLQLTGLIPVAILVPVLSAANGIFSLKLITLLCYGTSILLTAVLFSCPSIWISLVLIATTKSLAQIVAVLVWVEIGRIFPARVRTTLVGIGGFFMLALLPLYPLLIKILSKESQHYLTAITIGMFIYRFVGALLLPSDDAMKSIDDN